VVFEDSVTVKTSDRVEENGKMTESSDQLERSSIKRHFSEAAAFFDSAALVHQRVAGELVDRLQYVRLSPAAALDLGCATGFCTALLAERFPQTQLVGLDLSFAMLTHSSMLQARAGRVAGDAELLPLVEQSFDLVVSNLLLPWCEPANLFGEVYRVLRPAGVFVFSSLGPDTLKELKRAWSIVDDTPHVHTFIDMHNLGDRLLAAGFAEPVMDTEVLTVTYDTLSGLLDELRATGGSNALYARRRTLTGRRRAERLQTAYESFRGADGRLPSTWEIVYGVAWRPERPVSGEPRGVGVPVRLGD
jgi:malonyl-CoA O-methyltransferase